MEWLWFCYGLPMKGLRTALAQKLIQYFIQRSKVIF